MFQICPKLWCSELNSELNSCFKTGDETPKSHTYQSLRLKTLPIDHNGPISTTFCSDFFYLLSLCQSHASIFNCFFLSQFISFSYDYLNNYKLSFWLSFLVIIKYQRKKFMEKFLVFKISKGKLAVSLQFNIIDTSPHNYHLFHVIMHILCF